MSKWQHKRSTVEAWQFKGQMPNAKAPQWVQDLAESGKLEQTSGDTLTVRLFQDGIDLCHKEDFIVKSEDGFFVGRRGVFDDTYEQVGEAS